MRQKEDNKVKEIKRVHLNSSAVTPTWDFIKTPR